MALVPINDVLKRRNLQGTAPPTAGDFYQGEVVWNTTPSAGSPVGWMCTVSGAPGTWLPFATL